MLSPRTFFFTALFCCGLLVIVYLIKVFRFLVPKIIPAIKSLHGAQISLPDPARAAFITFIVLFLGGFITGALIDELYGCDPANFTDEYIGFGIMFLSLPGAVGVYYLLKLLYQRKETKLKVGVPKAQVLKRTS